MTFRSLYLYQNNINHDNKFFNINEIPKTEWYDIIIFKTFKKNGMRMVDECTAVFVFA